MQFITSKVILNRLLLNGFEKKSKGGGELEKSQNVKKSHKCDNPKKMLGIKSAGDQVFLFRRRVFSGKVEKIVMTDMTFDLSTLLLVPAFKQDRLIRFQLVTC